VRPPAPGDREPRLFVAVPLDEAAVAALTAVVEGVRSGIEDGRGIRWVRLEGLHLTLRFLGPTAPGRVDDVAEAVREAAEGQAPIRMEIAGAGAFPPRGRPRALWFGLADGADALTALAARLDDALERRGWDREDRPFRAHVTVARTDGARSGATAASALRAAAAELRVTSTADRVVLFESITGGGPARYVALAEASLAGSGAGPSTPPGRPDGGPATPAD
jgi:RNA 2',3'-cyclic 3'-phosphodiesterase